MDDWKSKIEEAERPEPTNRRHILALSGGKDSTAMALACARYEPNDYTYVCTPTGDELPEMEAHWQMLEDKLGKPLMRLGERTLMGLIVEQKALPNHTARWCTRIIKLEQYYSWLRTLGPVISHVGLRADEQSRPGMIFPDADNIQMDFPMRRWGWTIADVKQFLSDENISIPSRTDCALCFWQKLGEWYLLWRDHPERFERGIDLEDFVTIHRGTHYTFRSPQRDAWPASLRDLKKEFEKGRVPEVSLRRMERDKNRDIGTCRVCTL
jgi:hypothetical protein